MMVLEDRRRRSPGLIERREAVLQLDLLEASSSTTCPKTGPEWPRAGQGGLVGWWLSIDPQPLPLLLLLLLLLASLEQACSAARAAEARRKESEKGEEGEWRSVREL